MAKSKQKIEERVVFIDATDFFHEMGAARGGNKVYASLNDTFECQPCSKECGVVKAKVSFVKQVHSSNYDSSNTKAADEWEIYTQSEEYLSHLLNKLQEAQEKVDNIKKTITRNLSTRPPELCLTHPNACVRELTKQLLNSKKDA